MRAFGERGGEGEGEGGGGGRRRMTGGKMKVKAMRGGRFVSGGEE